MIMVIKVDLNYLPVIYCISPTHTSIKTAVKTNVVVKRCVNSIEKCIKMQFHSSSYISYTFLSNRTHT